MVSSLGSVLTSLTAGADCLCPVDTPRPRDLTGGGAMTVKLTGMSKGDSEEESGPRRACKSKEPS